jgi:ABC-type phosphate/phosphonate transport system substrate-binding protein
MQHRILILVVGISLLAHGPAAAEDPDVIHIGLVDSLVKDLSPARKKILDSDFPDLVKEFTGFKSQVKQGGDPLAAAKKLEEGAWHLGVFQGIEFAWAQSKDAKVQPLILAVNSKEPVHGLLVVKKGSNLKGFTDLKGKDVRVLQSREHCRLFAEKEAGGDAKSYFGKVLPTRSAQEALDDVLLDKAQAAVVDTAAMEYYQDVHPGRHKRLEALAKSEQFPPTVIAYRQGGLSETALKRFQDGMLKANKTDRGREAMADVGITSFEPVPADFSKLLASIAKSYPPPGK